MTCLFVVTADVSKQIFRTPSVASLPDPPTKPVVSDVTDTTVHLSWAPGTQIGSSPVFAFQVDYFGFDTTDVSHIIYFSSHFYFNFLTFPSLHLWTYFSSCIVKCHTTVFITL